MMQVLIEQAGKIYARLLVDVAGNIIISYGFVVEGFI